MSVCWNPQCSEGGGGGGFGFDGGNDAFGLDYRGARFGEVLSAGDLLASHQATLAWDRLHGTYNQGQPSGAAVSAAGSTPGTSAPGLDLSGVPAVVAQWAAKLGVPTWLLWLVISVLLFEVLHSAKVL